MPLSVGWKPYAFVCLFVVIKAGLVCPQSLGRGDPTGTLTLDMSEKPQCGYSVRAGLGSFGRIVQLGTFFTLNAEINLWGLFEHQCM